MKTASLIFFIIAAPLLLRAQESKTTSNYPHWLISKDVQRPAYRKTLYAPLKIELTDVSALVSKNIHRKSRTRTGTATFQGYPSWTISKPAARQTSKKRQAAKD